MASLKRINLCLRSNIDRYRLTFYDGCCYKIVDVKGYCERVSMVTDVEVLKIVASPFYGGYYNKLFLKLNLQRKNTFDLYFKFLKRTEPLYKYIFNLTDVNYGLKINGKLFFNKK